MGGIELIVFGIVIIAFGFATVAFSGAISIRANGNNAIAGNESGSTTFQYNDNRTLQPSAVVPAIESGGGYQGSFTCPTTGGTLNLADSTNICKTGAVGNIAPAQGYIITAVKKLRTLILENNDLTASVVVTVPATLGLAGLGWAATNPVVTLQPNGGKIVLEFPAGSAVLTAGSNDALLFTASAGTPSVSIFATFG